MQQSTDVDRRSIIQNSVVGMAVSPLLESLPASARQKKPKPIPKLFPWQTGQAPMIILFDHTGCTRPPAEYKGEKSNSADDERCIKISMKKIEYEDAQVRQFNVERQAQYGSRYQDLVITGYHGLYTPRKVGEGLRLPEDRRYEN